MNNRNLFYCENPALRRRVPVHDISRNYSNPNIYTIPIILLWVTSAEKKPGRPGLFVLHYSLTLLCLFKIKKVRISILTFCAQNRNRTCTSLLIPDFESDASTSSAIWAYFNKPFKYSLPTPLLKYFSLFLACALFSNSST